MSTVTLHCQPRAAPPSECCVCQARIAAGLQDTILVDQDDTRVLEAAICMRCRKVLSRVVDMLGTRLTFLIQEHAQDVDELVGGPSHTKAHEIRTDLSSGTDR